MSDEQRSGLLARARRRLPEPLRRRLLRLASPIRARGGVGIVVLLEGEPIAARSTLDSVLAQPHDEAQEIVVVTGDPTLAPIAEGAQAQDVRVRVVAAADPHGALDALHGQWVLVVPAGTVLRPGAVVALRRGADDDTRPVVGGLDGHGPQPGQQPGPHPEPHPGSSHDLRTAPSAAADPDPAKVLLPRRALDATTLSSIRSPATVLGLLASGFLAVPEEVASIPRPGTQRSLYLDRPWDRLERLVADDEAASVLLADHADAAAAYCLSALDRHAAHLAEHVEDAGATAAAWQRYVTHVRHLHERAGDLTALPVLTRVQLWLVAEDRRAALTDLVVARRFAAGLSTVVDPDGAVRAVIEGLPGDVPPALLVLSEAQTPLRVRLARVRRGDDHVELTLHAALAEVEQTDLATVTAEIAAGGSTVPAAVSADPEVTRWVADPAHSHDAGVLVARLPPTATGPFTVTLTVGPVTRAGVVRDLDDRGSAGARARTTPAGVVLRPDARATGPVRSLTIEGPDVVLDGAPAGAELVGAGLRIPVHDGRARLEADPWGFGPLPAPTGGYRLVVDRRPVTVADGLLDELPLDVLTDHHRVLVRAGPAGGLVVRLDPPLADDERGPRAQALLQASYQERSREPREPIDPGLVYFQSFTGQAADHPLAIQIELRRRRPDLRMRWLVADASVPVPDGAEPVQIRSREWYDVLARAGHVVINIDPDRWFVDRPDQRVLQTIHGYPSKRIGIDQWRARGFPDSRIAADLARSSGTWDVLVSPQPDADHWYREQYAYDGPIISEGYPRNDPLVDDEAPARRQRARERLGAGDRHVLLYAPTWRDDLVTNFRAARLEHHLDPARLAAELGPDWLVLLRGHRFHAPAAADGVLDVTTYPDVNDLILAADASVQDYSSLRFDMALTGRPMVFLVPDLDSYSGRVRGFLQHYPDTAPGPLVETEAEVLAELRDLDALTARWARPLADFNAVWNTRMDGHASERVVAAFFADLLSDPPEDAQSG